MNQLAGDLADRKHISDEDAGVAFARTNPATCAQPHKGSWFKAGCRKELGRLISSKLAGDWAVASIQDSAAQNAASLKEWDDVWIKWHAQWTANNVPQTENDEYFEGTFGPRSYSIYNMARLNAARSIASRLVAARSGQTAAHADSALLMSRCFDQLDIARDAHDDAFTIDLAVQSAKQCASRLYSELLDSRR